jgi:hypothetical protein
MSLKNLVENVVALKSQTNAVNREIEANFGAVILERAKRFIVAEHDTNRGYGYPGPKANFRWSVEDAESLFIEWDEHWSYGGQDEGSFTLPLEMVLDDGTLLTAYEAKRKAEKDAVDREKARAEIAKAQRVLLASIEAQRKLEEQQA